jgi:hypothetical protein
MSDHDSTHIVSWFLGFILGFHDDSIFLDIISLIFVPWPCRKTNLFCLLRQRKICGLTSLGLVHWLTFLEILSPLC